MVLWSLKPGPEASGRRLRAIAAAAVALLAGVVVSGEAHAQESTGLGIKLPSVEVKLDPVAVKVPSVEVDLSPVQVQVPSVEVKLPPAEVKLPPVEATVAPLDVKVSPAETPAPVRTPEPPTSTAPRAPSGGGDSPAKGQDVRAHETSAAGVPEPPASGGAGGRDRGARGGSPARRDAVTGTRPTRTDPGRGRAAPPAVRRRERRLRELVRSLSGCLGGLPTIETRVLTLRAGGATRRQVARRLDLGVSRVAATERRGLDRLRAHARDGGCGGQPDPAVTLVAADPGGAGPSTVPGAGTPPNTAARGAVGAVEAVGRSLGDRTASEPTPATLIAGTTGPPLLLMLVGAYLAGFALNWVRETRTMARRPAAS